MVLPLIPIVGSGPTWTRQATGEHAKGGRTMLKREINELLTRTGPGTPMGELFRRYWLQALEGGIDSSHVSWLHSAGLKNDPLFKGSKANEYNLGDMKPFFEVVEVDGGLFIGARRNADDGRYYWRITPWVMPSFTMIPPRGNHPVHGHFWVPIDDENCWVFTFDYHSDRPLTPDELAAMRAGHGVHNKYVPGTYRPLNKKYNDYMMDLETQKRGETFSGVKGIAM